MIKKILLSKYTFKPIHIIIPLIIIQLVLPLRPIALLLIEQLNIPFIILATFEAITVPITVLIVSIFIIQKLNWRWLKNIPFIAGFIAIALFHWTFLLLNTIRIYLSIPEFIENIYSYIFNIHWFFIKIILLLYTGWSRWSMMSLYMGLLLFVFMPIIFGILTSLVNFIYQAIRQKIKQAHEN